MSIKINGLDQIKRDLQRYPTEAPKVYGEAIGKAAARFRDHTKAHPDVPVATSRMRNSINNRRIMQLAAGVFVGVGYGVFVHEGTNRMEKRPFFLWALRDGAQKAIDEIFAAAMKLLPHR